MSTNKLEKLKLSANGTQSLILRTVRDYSPISRSGIVNVSGLPHAATSRAVASLLENGTLIEEHLADKNGPRRKRGISLCPERGYSIAVEYSASRIEGIVLNTAYRKIAEKKLTVDLNKLKQKEIILKIISFIRTFVAECKLPRNRCLGIALIDPGVIDTNRQVSICCSTLESWQNVAISAIIEKEFDLPVTLTNTSMAKIRAVDRLDIEGQHDNLLYIEYGEGIGCGLKLKGNYVSGQHNLAGELGHMRVTDNPVPCRCGGLGCLESVAALPVIAENARSALKDNTSSILNSHNAISGLLVLEAAARGDRLSSHIVDKAFDYLGRAVAGVVNIINPEIVVFDHLIKKTGEEAIATLTRSLQKNTLSTHWNDLRILFSNIDSFIGPLGGAVTVLDDCLEY